MKFVAEPGLEFARKTKRKYDLIFLDGDHAATAVYQEIPAALTMLAPNGVILLHDFFPGNKPLWAGSSPIQGPVLAVQRLRTDGMAIQVVPLAHFRGLQRRAPTSRAWRSRHAKCRAP